MDIEELYDLLKSVDFAFTTDSRTPTSGGIFFALKGAHFNGNLFAEQAIISGARYAVVDEQIEPADPRKIVVKDVLETLQRLATHHRRQFNIPVLAVGGSNGKTTTKELLVLVLSKKFRTHGTAGNLNNLIGVPLSLLRMPLSTEFAVIEIGTNQFGEIEQLCRILEPNYGLITNIGKEHLEGFGDIEGVTREESALYHYLIQTGGLAFVNADDPILHNMAKRLKRSYSYGFAEHADHKAIGTRFVPDILFQGPDGEIHSPLSGTYNAQNVLAASAVGHYFEVSAAAMQEAVQEYRGGQNRSEYRRMGETGILLDAYNANPSSMEAALIAFRDLRCGQKLILLGDMLELGKCAPEEHRYILDLALSISGSRVCVAGPLFTEAALDRGVSYFPDSNSLKQFLETNDWSGFEVLIKGSRGMQMEKVLSAFEK